MVHAVRTIAENQTFDSRLCTDLRLPLDIGLGPAGLLVLSVAIRVVSVGLWLSIPVGLSYVVEARPRVFVCMCTRGPCVIQCRCFGRCGR